MYRPFDMDPSWDRHHNWNIRTDSRTLPQAAFPSLPLNHPPLASATSQPRTSSHPIDTTESDDDEFDESGIEDTTDDDTTDQDTVDAAETVDDNRYEPSLWTERQLASINSYISRAVRYHFDEPHPQDRDAEDEIRAEHKLLCDADLLPEVRNPRKIRPRSVNMVQLQSTNRELRRKKERLIRELCKLGYESSDIEACVLWKTAEIMPEKPGNIDAYCLSNYNLKWLNEKLKLLVDNRRAVVDARKNFLAEASSPADSPIVKPRKRRSRRPVPKVIHPLELLEGSDEFPPGSRRANPYPSTNIPAESAFDDPYYSWVYHLHNNDQTRDGILPVQAGDPTYHDPYYLFESMLHNDDHTHNNPLPFQAGSQTAQHYPPPLRGTFSDVGRESHSAAEYNQYQALERANNFLSQP
jgi:hypothetical protein